MTVLAVVVAVSTALAATAALKIHVESKRRVYIGRVAEISIRRYTNMELSVTLFSGACALHVSRCEMWPGASSQADLATCAGGVVWSGHQEQIFYNTIE